MRIEIRNRRLLLFAFAAALNAQPVSTAAKIIQAKTDSEAKAMLDSIPLDQLAEVARDVAAQSYQIAQRGDQARGLRLVTLAEAAADRTGDLESRAMCRYWHSVLVITGGNTENALALSRETIAWARETRAASGLYQVAGDALRQLGDYTEAVAEYGHALDAARTLGSPLREAQVRNSLGLAYFLGGQYRLAFQEYEKALPVAEKEKQAELVSSIKNNLGNLYGAQDRPDLAIRYYEESLAIKRAQGVKPRILTTLANLAGLANSMKKNDLARKYLAEAFPLAEESGNAALIAFCYGQRGQVEIDEGNLDAGIRDLERALDGIAPVDRPSVLIQLSRAMLKKNDTSAALDYALQSRAAADQSEYPEAQWRTESLLGAIYRKQSKPAEAEASFRRAISIIEDLRNNIAGVEEDRQRYLEDKLEPYRGLFSLMAGEERTGEAFAVAEQMKGRVLAEIAGDGKFRITKGMTNAEREREQTLRRRLTAARQSHTDLNRAAGDYAEFQTALYASHPELALQRSRFDPARPSEIASQLRDPQTAAIEYVVAEESVFALVIAGGDSGVHLYKLSAKALASKAARFRSALAGRELGFQSLARELYDDLIAPIKEVRGKRTLIVVPDGPLWQAPFQAFQSPKGNFLIEDAAIFYAPSFTVLSKIHKVKRAPTSVLALGNPLISSDAGLPPLPISEQEVSEIGRL